MRPYAAPSARTALLLPFLPLPYATLPVRLITRVRGALRRFHGAFAPSARLQGARPDGRKAQGRMAQGPRPKAFLPWALRAREAAAAACEVKSETKITLLKSETSFTFGVPYSAVLY